VARAFLEDVPEARFTESTVRRMLELVDQAKTDEKFQKLVYGIVNRSMRGDWKDYRREVEVMLDWFKKRHDYRRDPHNVELLQDVWATMDRKRFDCDDATIFMCAAAEVLGAPCRVVTVSTRQNREPSHVYPQAFLEGQWQGIDAIMPWSTVGWEPTDGITAKRVWTRKDVGLAGYEEPAMEGLGHMRYLESSNPDGWTDDRYNVGPQRSRWEGGFAQNMEVVNPTGFPNDVSDSFSPGMPGAVVRGKRITPSHDILSVSDRKELPYAGGTPPAEYPITSHQTPGQLWENVPASRLPLDFDKNEWTGEVPENISTVDYTLPQPYTRPGEGIIDLAGLGGLGMVELEGVMSDAEVETELDGLLDEEVEGQLQQLGYFLGDDEDDGTLGRRGRKRGLMRRRLAAHKKAHRGSMSFFKRRRRPMEAASPSEQEGNPGLHRGHEIAPGQEDMDGLGTYMTDSYLSNTEYGNPGYMADAYIDTELQMEGVRLGRLTKGERDTLRREFKKCRAECHRKWKSGRERERLDGLDCGPGCAPVSGLGGLGANHLTDSYLAGARLGAVDWMSAVSGIASSVVSGVTGGLIQPTQVQGAINTAVSYYTGTGSVPTPTQIVRPPPTVAQKAAFGVGTLVPIGIGLFVLSKVMGKKRR
jgi:hypothetical protein